MALVLVTGSGEKALDYLLAARKTKTQKEIASHLGVDVRTVRRWQAGEVEPPPYIVPALQQLLPLEVPLQGEPDFRFIVKGNRIFPRVVIQISPLGCG